MKENPTLNIKDLVLLKSNPQKYIEKQLQTIKTHDGTSSGPIKSYLHQMVEKYSKDAYAHQMIISSDGKLINQYDDLTGSTCVIGNGMKHVLGHESRKDNPNSNYNRDVHVISNIGYEDEESHHRYDVPNSTDLRELMKQDSEGEYYIRSLTLVGKEGSSMTIVRDNSFGPESHEAYSEICDNWRVTLNKWHEENVTKPTMAEYERLEQEFIKEHGREPTFDEAWGKGGLHAQSYNVIKGKPTMAEYIANELGPEFEKCGVKIKYQKNDHIPYKGEDPDISVERWREELYKYEGTDEYGHLWNEYFYNEPDW